MFALAGAGLTVNERSLVVAGHEPLAAMVYLTVTTVLDPILGGVYVVPLILPPPLITFQLPPPGLPVKALV